MVVVEEEVSADVDQKEVVVLATETHSLALRWRRRPQNKRDNFTSEEERNDEGASSSSQTLSDLSSFPNAVCVGYAACGDWRVATFLRPSALVAPSQPPTADPSTTAHAPFASFSHGDPSATVPRGPVTVAHHSRAASSASEVATMASTATNEEILSTTEGGFNAGTQQQQQQNHHRRSGSWTSLALEAATAATTPGGGEGGITSSSGAAPLHASFSGLSLVGPDELNALYSSSPLNPHAELVLWWQRDCDGPDDHGNGPDRRNVWRVALDFRPVAPALSLWEVGDDNSNEEGSNNNNHPCLGVWLGSADDRKLRLYCPDWVSTSLHFSSSSSTQELVLVELTIASSFRCDDTPVPSTSSTDDSSEAAFAFPSPVLALDALPHSGAKDDSKVDKWHCLAAACQDGTIRLVRYCTSMGSSPHRDSANTVVTLTHVRAHTLIVDGPIACIGLSRGRHPDSLLRCVIGSLCGFACEVVWNGKDDTAGNDGTWEGPHLVAYGLRNVRLGCEDSVLAVGTADVARQGRGSIVASHHHRLVAVGTHEGRCLVYGAVKSATATTTTTTTARPLSSSMATYELLWSCTLPYPVHGVAFGSNCSRLVVTTRRSAHLFRGTVRWWSAFASLRRVRALRDTVLSPSAAGGGGSFRDAEPGLASESSDKEDDDFVLVSSDGSSAPEQAVTTTTAAAADDGPDRPQTPLDAA